MSKDELIKIVNKKYNKNSKKIIKEQIESYNVLKNIKIKKKKYEIGDKVYLKKGILLHGTYKNLEGLKEIVKNGLISSDFTKGRNSKYPSCVGVWNLKKDYYLKDYVNFYSGGTVSIMNSDGSKRKTKVIPYDKMNTIMNNFTKDKNCFRWYMEQTKEARFMPSLSQDEVQIGIIFSKNKHMKELLKGDILNNLSDKEVKSFVNPKYYEKFIIDRKSKDDFFTDRESAVLYGIPSNFIEGILVGRKYEKNKIVLNKIKNLLPDCYICNLDGIVIKY